MGKKMHLFLIMTIACLCLFYTGKVSAGTLGKVQITEVNTSKQNKIFLKWNAIKNASGYQISVSDSKQGGTNRILGNVKNPQCTIRTGNGKSFYVKIRAYKKTTSGTEYGSYSEAKKVTEIGAVWYKKILKNKTKAYNVRTQTSPKYTYEKAYLKDFDSYTVIDLNKDGIKELILHSAPISLIDWNPNEIFLLTYYNDKICPLLRIGGSGARGRFFVSGTKLAVCLGGSDSSYNVHFTVSEGKLVKKYDLEYIHDKSDRYNHKQIYRIKGKSATASEWQKACDKYFPLSAKELSFSRRW